uniref:calcipressin-1 n=1 Tax=Lonchura striata TaxID=40157 RepID=UPI001293107B|nr:calcipressin-1 [Lonchura striata domestica]
MAGGGREKPPQRRRRSRLRSPPTMEEPPLQQPPPPPGEDEEEGEEEEEEEADAEWSFVDREMEAVALRDLPTATIACRLDPRVFQDGPCRAKFESLFRPYDRDLTFQYFKSFKRVRINFSNPLSAAEARIQLDKTEFLGKELKLYFAQVKKKLVGIILGGIKAFLVLIPINPPADGWKNIPHHVPFSEEFRCLPAGDKYELHAATATTPSVVVHVCESDQESEAEEEPRKPKPKIIQTRRPDYAPAHLS